ncbi:hypothetical protein PPERSA_02017 [Pseudocohnilembus persalinus]|uniref:Uncharacterized protein n=1 Tax=Pseudocohnilembus persalinus TaxID=266149 RepID=A0A0V0QF72_PSEPJ|nr:hypothetical protein PPERSA_02017 [Pseudocohnilembus persalinus]|eukprot:KRX00838.1 hypothetical protein PPERSA_02017 [Pseudocohnilembus persalinus]
MLIYKNLEYNITQQIDKILIYNKIDLKFRELIKELEIEENKQLKTELKFKEFSREGRLRQFPRKDYLELGKTDFETTNDPTPGVQNNPYMFSLTIQSSILNN